VAGIRQQHAKAVIDS